MKAAKQNAVFELLQHPCFKTGSWVCHTMRDKTLGDYGRRETYSWDGVPVFQLEISFNPPKTRAFIAEEWRRMDVLKEQQP